MKKYTVAAVPGGYAVVHQHALLGLTSVEECHTREGAYAGAARWNLRHETEQAKQALSLAVHREHAMQPRRSVRWIEPDAFA